MVCCTTLWWDGAGKGRGWKTTAITYCWQQQHVCGRTAQLSDISSGATCVADLDSRALALTKEASGNSHDWAVTLHYLPRKTRWTLLYTTSAERLYITHIIVVASVDVHLAKAKEGQHKTARGELCRLVVVLKGLIIIFLDMECSSQLVAALSSHGFILGVVEGMESQVLDLLVVL